MSLPAAGTEDASARKPRQIFKLEGHTSLIRDVIHLPDGEHIITCSVDSSLRVWNLKNGLQIGTPWQDGKSPVHTIALSPDGKTVMSGSDDGIMRLWNIKTAKVIAKWTGHSTRVLSICWSRNGQRVVSGSADGTARMWDVESGETILGPIHIGHKVVLALAYSPDETMIATGASGASSVPSDDDKVKIWDTKAFKLVTTLKGYTENVRCLSWTRVGNKLVSVSGSLESSIRIWNTNTWKQFAVLTEQHDSIYGIAISPDGRILASASADRTARLWDLEDCQPIGSPLRHPTKVLRVSFSRDGGLLATGCSGGNAYTWDISTIVKEAGLDGLLLDSDLKLQPPQGSGRKSVLDADATRRLPHWSVSHTRRLQQPGFFDDTGDRIQSSLNAGAPPCQTSTSRPHALLDRFSSLFSRSHPAVRDATSHSRSTPFRPLNWAIANFSRHHRPDSWRHPAEVDVPCTRGQARNIKVARQSKKKKVPVPNNIMLISVAGPSRLPNSGAPPQSSGNDSGQTASSQSQPVVNTAAAGAVTTTITSATAVPSQSSTSDIVVIRHVSRWTRFWLFFCCIPTERHH